MSDIKKIEINGKTAKFNIYVQGDLEERNHKTVILTVHDIGTNHKSFVRFVDHPSMAEVKKNAVFLHVCIPGQEDHAPDFQGEFPTLAQMAEDLVVALDQLDVRSCIAFGEGAGANIICRFALHSPNRINGIILLHCTSTTAGVFEYFKDKFINLRLENDVMTDGAWELLVMHKLGNNNKKDKQAYIDELKSTLNPKNLSKYLFAFSKRTDFSTVLGAKLDT
uniref:Alpha/beta-hydrolase n=2 Tax=Bursaphelenchus xylophilus TaxID=6326 RepID=A0A1I7SQZ3_BURXY